MAGMTIRTIGRSLEASERTLAAARRGFKTVAEGGAGKPGHVQLQFTPDEQREFDLPPAMGVRMSGSRATFGAPVRLSDGQSQFETPRYLADALDSVHPVSQPPLVHPAYPVPAGDPLIDPAAARAAGHEVIEIDHGPLKPRGAIALRSAPPVAVLDTKGELAPNNVMAHARLLCLADAPALRWNRHLSALGFARQLREITKQDPKAAPPGDGAFAEPRTDPVND